MAKIYLVDTENVSTAWMSILDTMEQEDRVILFATELSGKLSYREVEKYIAFKEKIKVIYCERKAKNALDFQLVSYLGYLLRMDDKNEYIIVSRDNGFNVMESFWKSMSRTVSVKKVKSNNNQNAQELPLVQDLHLEDFFEPKVEEVALVEIVVDKKKELVAGLIAEGVINEEVENSCAILDRHSKNKLAVIYREFVQKFGQANGQKLYRAVKPHLTEYYSTK